VTSPLTLGGLLDNALNAWAYSRLRVPLDPFDAEVRFCGTPRMDDFSAGGEGGIAFRWRCPSGQTLRGLHGTFKNEDLAIATVQPTCRANHDHTNEGGDDFLGPTLGEPSNAPFEVSCPLGAVATGIYGWSDTMIRSLGVLCLRDGAILPTSKGGADRGAAFSLSCPGERSVVGVEGRSGALIDALGILCLR
jgi:hypothetical protein